MSGSETGLNVMTPNREPFNAGGVLQKSTVQPSVQNMRLAFSADGTAVYKPITPTSPSHRTSGGGGGGGGDASAGGSTPGTSQGLNMNMGSEQMKRKRGRPRKYGPDGTMALALVPQSGGGFSSPPAASPNSMKKARGRPPGSGKKHQLEALGNPYNILLAV